MAGDQDFSKDTLESITVSSIMTLKRSGFSPILVVNIMTKLA